jgi:NAD-dependent SIR2 family protein deacetylase
MPKQRVAVILGAGFSRCADLPLQSEFSAELLRSDRDDEIGQVISTAITRFVEFTFGWRSGDQLPPLEDIFTTIDLSANTGHAVGRSYPPKKLRALRRFLIHRVFTILDRRFHRSRPISDLIRNLRHRDRAAAFIVLNWDIVLEKHLQDGGRRHTIAYHVNEKPWRNGSGPQEGPEESIIKVHGSANWVYCDNCRQIFYDLDQKLSLRINASLTDDDLRLFDSDWPAGRLEKISNRRPDCPDCRSAVGPHIATFSYRKSFRTAAFTQSWIAAEAALSEADRWLFVGYSLPQADYEFAHLLKTAELKLARNRSRPKRIDVVVRNDEKAEERYRQMFGTAIAHVEQGGLEGYLDRPLTRFLRFGSENAP